MTIEVKNPALVLSNAMSRTEKQTEIMRAMKLLADQKNDFDFQLDVCQIAIEHVQKRLTVLAELYQEYDIEKL